MAHPVLLVEDDEEVREGLKAALQTQGYDVECATDGLEALRILQDGVRPCVILLDVMLPRVDGYVFRNFQRADARWADIPVIVVSALNDRPDRTEMLEPEAWFEKPIDIDALTVTLAHYC